MKTFKEFGFSDEIMQSLDDLGFVEPSPVQAEAIPFILKSEQDLIALAQTGTGKTAAFTLPILQKIETNGTSLQAIIMCPTRELCLQISQDIRDLAKHSKGVVVTSVYGGERIETQIRSLKRGTNIVVGTPGRVHDLIRRKILKLQDIKWLVLDEADEMLDMGFKEDLDAVLEQVPEERQTLLFSATMSKSVSAIAKRYMTDAYEISMGDKNIGAENISHQYYIVSPRDRFEALKRILDCLPGVYGILFCRTRRETQEVADKLRQSNYEVEAIHGDVSQNIRTKIMDRFKKKQIRLLVATDVAARGIDVKDLTHVINYNLPDQNISYTHRSGRTGRAKQSGISVSIVGSREVRIIKELERTIGKPFELKTVPKGEDVYKTLIDHFVNSIAHPDLKDNTDEEYVSEVVERLSAIKKEDLIRYFVSKELAPLIADHKNTRDLNAQAGFGGEKRFGTKIPGEKRKEIANAVNLNINFGKKQGLNIKAFFGLINSSNDLRGMDIGNIDLGSDSSNFAVDQKHAERVIKGLSAIKYKGKNIQVTKGEASASYERPRYSNDRRSKPSYSKGRSNGGRGRGSGKQRPNGRFRSKSGGFKRASRR